MNGEPAVHHPPPSNPDESATLPFVIPTVAEGICECALRPSQISLTNPNLKQKSHPTEVEGPAASNADFVRVRGDSRPRFPPNPSTSSIGEPTGSVAVSVRLPSPRFAPHIPRVCCCKHKAARRENTTFPFGPLHAIRSTSEQTQSQPVASLRDKFSWVPLQGAPRRMS